MKQQNRRPRVTMPEKIHQTIFLKGKKLEDGTSWHKVALDAVDIHPSIHVLAEDVRIPDLGVKTYSGNLAIENFSIAKKVTGDPKASGYCALFRNINDAIRGIVDVPDRYRTNELVKVSAARASVSRMLLNVYRRELDQPEGTRAYLESGQKAVATLAGSREENKVISLSAITAAVTINDRTGRRNTGRLPLILWKANKHLTARIEAARDIAGNMDDRLVALLDYHDQINLLTLWVRTIVEDLLKNKKATGARPTDHAMAKAGKLLEDIALRISGVIVRPYGPRSIRHWTEEFNEAAGDFRDGDAEAACNVLDRTKRSIEVMDIHAALEEINTTLHLFRNRLDTITDPEIEQLKHELDDIDEKLSKDGLDEGFICPVVSDMRRGVKTAMNAAVGFRKSPKAKFGVMKEGIEDACKIC